MIKEHDCIVLKTSEKCSTLGNTDILQRRLLALFCSVRCPGDVILKTYDLALHLRDMGVPVISGFHTPMERECLDVLLRGRQPVVVCPARRLSGMRMPDAWRRPVDEGRLLLISPFPEGPRRPTRALAERRNLLVADLADRVMILYAAPESRTAQLCRRLMESGKPVLTLACDADAHLITIGAQPVDPDNAISWTAVLQAGQIGI